MKTQVITAEPLTRKAFAPFGDVVDITIGKPVVESKIFSFWDKISPLDLLSEKGEPYLAFLRVKHRPFIVNQMERHVKATQAIIPLNGGISISVVAPPNDLKNPSALPDLSKAKAFICSGSQALNFKKGTWHWPAFPLSDSVDFVMVVRAGMPNDDFQVCDLKKNLSVQIKIMLDS